MGFSSFLRSLTHNRILLSHKKNEIMPFAATWMQLKIMLSEVSQKEKIYISYNITYMWNLKYGTKNKTWHKWTYLWNSKRESRLVAAEGRGRGKGWRGGLELIDANVLHLECINSSVLRYSTGTMFKSTTLQFKKLNKQTKPQTKTNKNDCFWEMGSTKLFSGEIKGEE